MIQKLMGIFGMAAETQAQNIDATANTVEVNEIGPGLTELTATENGEISNDDDDDDDDAWVRERYDLLMFDAERILKSFQETGEFNDSAASYLIHEIGAPQILSVLLAAHEYHERYLSI